MIQKTRKFTSFFLVFAILMMQITATVSAISPDDGMGSDFVGHFVSTNDNENLEKIAVDMPLPYTQIIRGFSHLLDHQNFFLLRCRLIHSLPTPPFLAIQKF